MPAQTVTEGGKATKPADPTKVGYVFDDWYAEDTYTTVFDFDTEIEADTTVYAKFVEAVTVSFDTDGGSTVADQVIASGGKATKPSDPTKSGYEFDDWYEEDTYTTVFDFDTEIEADTTIYGKFLELFTVTFNSDGGSAVTSQEIADGGKATEPEDPTKDGYTFGGWYKEDTLTTEFDFTTDTITADTTLYAKWTEVVQ